MVTGTLRAIRQSGVLEGEKAPQFMRNPMSNDEADKNITMKLPLCEITDFSPLWVCYGDPQNVWNHVPIKAVGRDLRLETKNSEEKQNIYY